MLYIDDKSKAAAEAARIVETAAPVSSAQPPAPKYSDVTAQWLEEATPNSHVVQDAQEYVKDGVTYKVDGHNVNLDYSAHEKEIAELLESTFGGELYMNPKINFPQGIRVPDYQFRGVGLDLKTLTLKATKDTMFQRIKKSSRQTRKFIVDVTDARKLTDKDLEEQIKKVFSHDDTAFVDEIIFVRDMQIMRVVKRT